MIELVYFVLAVLASSFKSKSRLEAENAALRHQLTVLQRKVRGRVQLTNGDRLFLVQLYRWFPSVLKAITIIRPETLVRWHRAGFRRYWRWKSRSLGGRPQIDVDLRVVFTRTATLEAAGKASLSTASRFPTSCGAINVKPVRFRPGRARLAANPASTGSACVWKMTGVVVAVLFAARAAWVPKAKITSTLSRIRSAVSSGSRSGLPSAHR